jgi:hypothetical protein
MSKKSLIASESLTVEQIKQASPARCRSNITPELVDRVNQLIADPEERERYQENFLGYLDVLKDPKFSLNKYIDAVRYVGYKLAGSTNQEAYTKTFPDRVQGMLDRGKDGGHIRAIVSAYNSGQLVNAILEQALIPTWVLNQDVYQEAINTQFQLMTGAKSEMARVQAANSILTHLKQPESSKVTLDVNVAEDETVKELRRAVTDLAREQQAAIERGSRTVIDIAEGDLIEGESERVDD